MVLVELKNIQSFDFNMGFGLQRACFPVFNCPMDEFSPCFSLSLEVLLHLSKNKNKYYVQLLGSTTFPYKTRSSLTLPLGNGAKDFPQPCFTMSASSERTRWPSESVPQKKGTLPSISYNNKTCTFKPRSRIAKLSQDQD